MIMKIGFIGVGNIGAPIAGQLLKAGYSLLVHDLRREAAETLLVAGAAWSRSVAELAGEGRGDLPAGTGRNAAGLLRTRRHRRAHRARRTVYRPYNELSCRRAAGS